MTLPGRDQKLLPKQPHYIFKRDLTVPPPAGLESCLFAMGCFWGAEKQFWQLEGVYLTAVGYAGGKTPNPSYEEVCTGETGHTEVVKVVYNSDKLGFAELLKTFWENHDPTQGMRQGNDIGSQYRSAIYCSTEEQLNQALSSLDSYQNKLREAGYNQITSEIAQAECFYFAEDYHQQYLAKNPRGYCGLGGTGVALD